MQESSSGIESGQKQVSESVVDHYYGEQGRQYYAKQAVRGRLAAQYNHHIWAPHIQPTDDVLDFGCGGGFLLDALQCGRKVGVEINPHARAYASTLDIDVHEHVSDVPGTFDKVISSHALEHVPHPRHAILELRDKLRSEESRLLLLLPLDDWRSGSQRRFVSGNQHMHLHTWTPQLLGNLLESCNLRVSGVRIIRHAWPPGGGMLWKLSPAVFHAAASVWSMLNRQRQLFAIAALPQ